MGRLLVYSTGSMLLTFRSGMNMSRLLLDLHMDVEWKRLLQERLGVNGEAHQDAKAFWEGLRNLRGFPNLDEKGREALERLS